MGKKSGNTHDPHDTRMMELFKNKEAFISFVKDCVKAEWTAEIDDGTLRRSPKSYVLPDFSRKEADVVYEATLNDGRQKVVFYILLEHQSRVDYRMNYRLLLYIVEILRDYYNTADVNERKRRDFKFPVVAPIVFYTGSREWRVPQNAKEMFEGYEKFGDYVLNFNYTLVEAKGYDEDRVGELRSKLLKIMMLFEKSRGIVEVLETAKRYREEIYGLNDEEKRVLGLAIDILSEVHGGGSEYDLKELIYAESAKGVDSMLSDVIANAKNYEKNLVKKGEKKGKKEMARETAREMLIDGEPIAKIVKYSKLSEKEIREIEKTI